MGWRTSASGADAGIATVGSYYFIVCYPSCQTSFEPQSKANPHFKGGLLMTLGGILEFILGNTFSFVVFCSFGPFIPPSYNTQKNQSWQYQAGFGSLLVAPWRQASMHSAPMMVTVTEKVYKVMASTPPLVCPPLYLLIAFVWLGFFSHRILLTFYGSAELDIPRLRIEDKHSLRCHLPGPIYDLRLTSCFVLASRNRAPWFGGEATSCKLWVVWTAIKTFSS